MARVAASPGGDQDALWSSLQAASQSWAAFDWNSRLAQLEKAVVNAKEQKEQSVTARKQLGDTTKQFKKSVKSMDQAAAGLSGNKSSVDAADTAIHAMESLSKECRKTVKSYQEEIDNLTRRCKSSEMACSTLHQGLLEVAEPNSLLGVVMEHMSGQKAQLAQLLRTVEEINREMANMESNFSNQSSKYQKEIAQLKEAKVAEVSSSALSKAEKEELVQLRSEVAEYEVEFRGLKNQDITIRKLEAKVAELQKEGEEELQKQLEKAQQDLAETEGRRAAEALEREAAMERKVQTLELQLKAERAGREATQVHLLEADEGAGEREAAWEAQRRILIDDAERLRETLHESTRERDELRLRVAAFEGDSTRNGPTPPPSTGLAVADVILERKAYEAEVAELSHTANLLREELRVNQETSGQEIHMLQTSIEALKNERDLLSSNAMSLESRLAAAPTQDMVDGMKRELRILKRLEYNAHDVDADRDPEMTGFAEDEEKDFESVLVAKLRRVESELVRERNLKLDQAKECEEMKRQLSEAEKTKVEAEKLVDALETDLQKAIASPQLQKQRKSVKIPTDVTSGDSPATLQKILDPDALTPPSSPVPVAPRSASSAAEKAEDDHSVATIVMAQRDRLRARCEALEAERDSFKRELQVQVQSSESLKSDNTKLYEKVRYLQNYNGPSGAGVRGAYNRSNSLTDRDLDLEALEQRYEASVDPFRQFGRSERQRKMREMSPMERIVFVVAKTFLGSKEMRTALFIYVCTMHFLVFVTTYHWSHAVACEAHDPDHLSHLPPVMSNGEVAKSAAEAVADSVGK